MLYEDLPLILVFFFFEISFFKKIYFIFGCIGPLLLHTGFL